MTKRISPLSTFQSPFSLGLILEQVAYQQAELAAVVLERALGCRYLSSSLLLALRLSEVESPWLVRCVCRSTASREGKGRHGRRKGIRNGRKGGEEGREGLRGKK